MASSCSAAQNGLLLNQLEFRLILSLYGQVYAAYSPGVALQVNACGQRRRPRKELVLFRSVLLSRALEDTDPPIQYLLEKHFEMALCSLYRGGHCVSRCICSNH